MNIDEFRADLEAEINNNALNFGNGTAAAFAEKITKLMQEAEYLNGDFQEAFFSGTHSKKRSNFRIDGYIRDEADNSIVLFTVHYSDDGKNMDKASAEKNFKMLESFVDAVLRTDLCNDIDESTSVAELAENLKAISDEKIKFILLTNAKRSNKLQEIKNFFACGKEVECQIWDIERIFAVYNSLQVREPVKIDFDEICGGLPCIKAANAGDDCESFLCVMPGKILADIYDLYGSRLLEGNVRSFLSTKRAVNKKIRETILNKPEKFFAFNNGIAATAKNIELELSTGGLHIKSVVDFQIINGGQTTASLSNARFKDKNNLEKIFVQMKLTRIGEMPSDKQEELIEEISRSSNSQNKVTDADFFSTHPFHVEMEKISRRIFAPPQSGFQYQTKWFYERARGQYVQEQMKMTPAQQKNFREKIQSLKS
ncbi:MAG: AIPR family protein [Selenomonadaceae bacterium]|nr:AIPR family protein [Selenomonadaceae bacterium]